MTCTLNPEGRSHEQPFRLRKPKDGDEDAVTKEMKKQAWKLGVLRGKDVLGSPTQIRGHPCSEDCDILDLILEHCTCCHAGSGQFLPTSKPFAA